MDIATARVWVTGASSGIGAALARELADRGARVAISARDAERLTAVAAGRMHVQPVDVTDRAATVAAGAAVREALGGLDLAVLNAGTWSQFHVEQWDSQAFADHLQVNLMGTVHSLEAVVPAMLAAGHGQIAGMASVAGYRGIPGSEAYGASKAALLNLLESLRASLGVRGIVVQTISPGFVRTPMTDRNRFPMPFMVEPEQAARSIADGIAKGKAEIVFPAPMMVAMKLARLVPVRPWTALTAVLARRGLHGGPANRAG
ncbi:SDR family NAD(P)-dependent oxidoreductase [Modestobacter sp. I12A-02628]|uniref:SDR family NAD(P)-dependent oxidoreductase n=1 Tax=Goekera deserti TaxID=2497753 RepID=A0A7K3WF94_9ACTN|nr:SDR family NAD(P)-dependent oxidoreductase [Goekera deserti]MPR00030.1 SDR family NAD(P)-dependent oxidoreductase [Goekera deserti]NDI49809.1 SDR family NAD(P)-dependent oxidoreductase [Goekera deserti]NEL55171.1 SDR family NAD(P)-dependent oxidoreductase [Goekera deserti]